uniref:Activating transcription factor 7-interacting protein Fn3 domain-containing protein n=1 Tax=Clytia hemisphaerica TaxID=252671 RepID=A0A7M5XHD8_9CNID
MSADPNMKAQQQNFKLVPVSSSKKNPAQIIRYQQKSQDNRLPTNDDLRNNKALSRSDYDFPASQDVSRLQPVSVSKIPIPCLLDIDGRPPPTYEETQRARLPNILTELTTDVESGAVVLKWNCTELSQNCQDNVRVYLLFAYHSDNIYAQPPSDIGRWMRIGEVDALPLPIACSLTKTFDGNCYFFTVVPVDKKGVLGTMSNLCVLDVSR